MESVRKSIEGRFGGEASLDELSVVARISRACFAYDTTIKASWKRIFALIREMLVVERHRQLDDGEQRTNTGRSRKPRKLHRGALADLAVAA